MGVRCPSHELARRLIDAAGVPVAAPSANKFGHVSPTTAAHVLDDLGGEDISILDGGASGAAQCEHGIESHGRRAEDGRYDMPPDAVSERRAAAGLVRDICSQVGARLNTAETYASESKPGLLGQPGQLPLTHYAPRLPAALCTVVADAAADDAKSDAYLANCVVVDFNGRLKALEKARARLPRLVISGRRGGRGERALRHAALGRGRPRRGERLHRRSLGRARVVGAHRRRRGPRLPRGVGQRHRDPVPLKSLRENKLTRHGRRRSSFFNATQSRQTTVELVAAGQRDGVAGVERCEANPTVPRLDDANRDLEAPTSRASTVAVSAVAFARPARISAVRTASGPADALHTGKLPTRTRSRATEWARPGSAPSPQTPAPPPFRFAADKTNTGRSTHFDDAVPMVDDRRLGHSEDPQHCGSDEMGHSNSHAANRQDLKCLGGPRREGRGDEAGAAPAVRRIAARRRDATATRDSSTVVAVARASISTPLSWAK